MKIENIVFHFPYRLGAGGVNILFLRLANHLASNTSLNIHIGDYEDGYMIGHNRNARVHNLSLKQNQVLRFPEKSVVIMQTLPPWHLSQYLVFPSGTKLLFWNAHPYNLLWDFRVDRAEQSRRYRIQTWCHHHLVRRFVARCHACNGFLFMDGENVRSVRAITGLSIRRPVYVPLCSGAPKRTPVVFGNRFAWLGRLGDFKTSILSYTISRLSDYARTVNRSIFFDVIGDGPDRRRIEDEVRKMEHEHFKCHFAGEVDMECVEEYLATNVNVLFAMGVSALDGARLGLPVVLLDFSYGPISGDYVYRFLYDTEDYSLGRDIKSQHYSKGNRSLEDILEALPDRYDEAGRRCYEYYERNHSLSSVADRLLGCIEQCRLEYSNIRFLRRSPLLSMNRVFLERYEPTIWNAYRCLRQRVGVN